MTKVVLVIGFIVAFSAGLFCGLAVRGREVQASSPVAASRPVTAGGPGGLLAAELGLTPEQREQMNRIWRDNARTLRHQQDQKRAQLRKEREEAIAALIHAEDRERYEQALRAHAERLAQMDGELRASWQSGVEETRKILTPEQRKKYDEFLKRREADRASGRDHDREQQQQQNREQQNRRADERATSRPGADK
jgi:Spy/CpxP family protein refolding chaperone